MSAEQLPWEIDCAATRRLLQEDTSALLLDCREQDEWDTVHITGSLLLPMSQLQARLGELEPHRGARVVVHCHHGGRSMRVAQWLRKQGYERAQSMAGGIDQWAQEIDPGLPRY